MRRFPVGSHNKLLHLCGVKMPEEFSGIFPLIKVAHGAETDA